MIQDNTVESTIDELHGYEPILLKEAAAEKRIAAIEGKNGINPKTKTKGGWGTGGGCGGGGAVVKTRPKWDNCGKHHTGVCNKPPKAAFADRLNKSGKPNWNAKEKLYIAKHVAQKVSEVTADGSDSEEDEDRRKKRKSKWSKGLDSGKKMFCMTLAQEDGYSNVDEADDDKIHNYKKKARRTAKQLKRSWGSDSSLAPPSASSQAKKKRRLPRFVGTPSGLTFDFKWLKQDAKTNAKRRYSDICVMVIGTNGKGRMLNCLLDLESGHGRLPL